MVAAEEREAMEDMAETVEPAVPAAKAGMVLLATAHLMAKPPTEGQAVLPAVVVREVMAAQAEPVAKVVTVALSILRLRRTSTEASMRLLVAVSAVVVGQPETLAKVDLRARQVKAVVAVEALAVHSAVLAARDQLEVREVQAPPVAAGMPDSPVLSEPMVV
jgi:hypothetical protein